MKASHLIWTAFPRWPAAGLGAVAACAVGIGIALTSCGGGSGGAGGPTSPLPGTPSNAALKAVIVAEGLNHPWALGFLPNGDMLVTEKAGTMRIVSADGANTSAPITGLPAVASAGQGGLLDVAIDPDFSATEPWVYWSYSEAATTSDGTIYGTTVARGKLVGTAMQNVQVLFQQTKVGGGNNHFGSRLVFGHDKTLFIGLGERMQDQPASPNTDNAQNLNKYLGKVVRINRDGSTAAGNPVWGPSGTALPNIWSTGHRNIQGAALNPVSGELWVAEHGPRGGDEINIARAGQNYGWPLRSYGCPYESAVAQPTCRVNGGTHAPDFVEPLTFWVPLSVAPSGMAFYTGSKLPQWRGNLFVGALSGQALWRLTLDGDTVASREELFKNEHGRIRDVRQGPDGWLYLLTDDSNGQILRIER